MVTPSTMTYIDGSQVGCAKYGQNMPEYARILVTQLKTIGSKFLCTDCYQNAAVVIQVEQG